MKFNNMLGLLIILAVVFVSGCIAITNPKRDILKIELKYGGGGTGGPWEGDDKVILDIPNNQLIITEYDGWDKTKSTTSTLNYNFDRIYLKIANLVKQNGLILNEYKRSEDCGVMDAAPGYVIVYFKDRTIKVEQDFCNDEKPYSLFNDISSIYKDIQKELKS